MKIRFVVMIFLTEKTERRTAHNIKRFTRGRSTNISNRQQLAWKELDHSLLVGDHQRGRSVAGLADDTATVPQWTHSPAVKGTQVDAPGRWRGRYELKAGRYRNSDTYRSPHR